MVARGLLRVVPGRGRVGGGGRMYIDAASCLEGAALCSGKTHERKNPLFGSMSFWDTSKILINSLRALERI